ncbi:MAG: zinc-dependent metalloprotease [Bacteroidota bacterium]|nr:zinc-dependent metalloprotease [Bacteroidota bacterium]MDP4288754.1 zinc-dependent metalloprotease [Bacteroidota bacterium]
MQWSTDPGYFSGGISAGSTGLGNFGDNGTITHGNIWLNNSNTFNDKYIFTTCPQHCTVLKPQLPVSICEVLLHELGHAFGLDDLQNDASGSRFSISVMWGDINAGKAGCNGFQGLQDIDKCYFCKLYCPANCEDLGTPLAPGDSSMSLSVFPNPATNSFTLNYRTDAVHPRIVIQDIQGRPVRSSKLDLAEGSMTLNRDNIPAGAYILKLEGPAHYVVKMLIIQ